jgi:hypothetical protein
MVYDDWSKQCPTCIVVRGSGWAHPLRTLEDVKDGVILSLGLDSRQVYIVSEETSDGPFNNQGFAKDGGRSAMV